jgi:hypothetical protein
MLRGTRQCCRNQSISDLLPLLSPSGSVTRRPPRTSPLTFRSRSFNPSQPPLSDPEHPDTIDPSCLAQLPVPELGPEPEPPLDTIQKWKLPEEIYNSRLAIGGLLRRLKGNKDGQRDRERGGAIGGGTELFRLALVRPNSGQSINALLAGEKKTPGVSSARPRSGKVILSREWAVSYLVIFFETVRITELIFVSL